MAAPCGARALLLLLLLGAARGLAPSHRLTARDLARLRAALERPFGDVRAAYHAVVGLSSLGLRLEDEKVSGGRGARHEARRGKEGAPRGCGDVGRPLPGSAALPCPALPELRLVKR